jgi:hypothetical protein
MNLCPLCCNCTGPNRSTMPAAAVKLLGLLLLIALVTLVRPTSAGSNPAAGLPRKLASTQAGINSTTADDTLRTQTPPKTRPDSVGVPLRPELWLSVPKPADYICMSMTRNLLSRGTKTAPNGPAAGGLSPIKEGGVTSEAEATSMRRGSQCPKASPSQASLSPSSRSLLINGDGCKYYSQWCWERNGTSLPRLVGRTVCS